MEPTGIWTRVFEIVQRELPVPTVWLAMQAVRPLAIDGNYFVAALPRQDEYLTSHLQDNQASTAIEDALRTVTGRVLAFQLIVGDSLADWEAQKASKAGATSTAEPPPAFFRSDSTAEPPPAFFRSDSTPPPPTSSEPGKNQPSASTREVSPTWEKLTERLTQGFRSASNVKFAHGQAQFVLTAVKIISDTIDVLMPPPGAPRDDVQERALAKVLERLSSAVKLDPIFISLELWRYRELQGKNVDLTL